MNCKHLAQVDSSVKGLDYLWGFVYFPVGSNQCSLLDFEMSPMNLLLPRTRRLVSKKA